jgi:hypothetical protein
LVRRGVPWSPNPPRLLTRHGVFSPPFPCSALRCTHNPSVRRAEGQTKIAGLSASALETGLRRARAPRGQRLHAFLKFGDPSVEKFPQEARHNRLNESADRVVY